MTQRPTAGDARRQPPPALLDLQVQHPQRVRKRLIICALSYTPHTNLHINKSTEA